MSLFAVENGYLDEIELEKIGDFEQALHSYMNSSQAELMQKINDTGDFGDDIENAMKAATDDFVANHSW